ncbi:hypothetical protein MTO96_052357 [Rhipicephalus appendiculatus]
MHANTHQSLGSDHYILAMQVHTSPCKPRPHVLSYTDWDAFRARRQHSATPDIDNLSQWTDQLLADLDRVTASIPTTANHPVIDSRLAHLQAAHTSLTNPWNKQRHNRRIPRRIAYLDREIETHTTVLARQQWEQLCSGLSSQLGSKQSWHLLRHLLDPTSAKSVTRQQLQRVIRAYPEGVQETVDPCGFPAGGPGGVVAEVGALELDDGRDDLWEELAPSGGNEAERSLCLHWVLPDR